MRQPTPLSLLTMTLLMVIALGGVLLSPRVAAAPGDARVRVFHASPGGSNFDVYANGKSLFTNLAYKQASDYTALSAGTYNLEIRAAGSPATSTATLAQPVTVLAGVDYTLVALDRSNQLKLFVLEDRYGGAPAPGNFKVRLVNAAVNAPNIDVYIPEIGANAFSNVGFYNFAGYIQAPAGTYTLQVRPNAVVSPLLTIPNHVDKPGTVETSFLVGVNGGTPALEYVTITDATFAGTTPPPANATPVPPASSPPPSQTGVISGTMLRFVQASPDAPNVDIYFDGQLAFSNLSYTDNSGYRQLSPGQHSLVIRAAGSPVTSTPTLATSIVLLKDVQYTAIALDRASTMRLLLLEDRPNADRQGSAQIRFVNAVINSPNLDLYQPETKTTIFNNFGFNNFTGYSYIPTGATTLSIRQNGTITDVFSGKITLNDGSRYTLMAVGNYGGEPNVKGIILQDFPLPEQSGGTPAPPPTTPSGSNSANLAFLHASPDAQNFDIYLSGKRLVDVLKYKELTSYRIVQPGSYTLAIYPAGANITTTQPVFNSTVNLEAQKYYILTMYGKAASLNVQLLVADLSKPAAGNAKVHFANYATMAGNGLSINNAATGAINIPFGGQSNYVAVPAGQFSFTYTPAGSSSAPITQGVTLVEGESYLFVALDGTNKVNVYGINERDTLINVK